jgi:hypothetical protein
MVHVRNTPASLQRLVHELLYGDPDCSTKRCYMRSGPSANPFRGSSSSTPAAVSFSKLNHPLKPYISLRVPFVKSGLQIVYSKVRVRRQQSSPLIGHDSPSWRTVESRSTIENDNSRGVLRHC